MYPRSCKVAITAHIAQGFQIQCLNTDLLELSINRTKAVPKKGTTNEARNRRTRAVVFPNTCRAGSEQGKPGNSNNYRLSFVLDLLQQIRDSIASCHSLDLRLPRRARMNTSRQARGRASKGNPSERTYLTLSMRWVILRHHVTGGGLPRETRSLEGPPCGEFGLGPRHR